MIILNYILATAGHVDHGKSALVRALSGIDPDRLPEEKARGITIDLGFAHLDLPAPSGDTFRLGIVDVPGHEDFVKNMVAGVGSVDLALLVVAADDGWMPQTEEHLQILAYLGVGRAVVTLTKIDLVQSEEAASRQVREKLAGTPLRDAPIVATSVVSGQGLEQLKAALACELARLSRPPDVGKPRLAVDRAFSLHGIGTVVTGTLSGGTLSRGQAVIIEPGARPARIRNLQSYNQNVEIATPGSRVALNLPDLHAGRAPQVGSISRGDVVTVGALAGSPDTVDVLLEVSSRLSESRPIKNGMKVRFHHGTRNVPALVYFQQPTALAPGARALAQFRLDSPVLAFLGDRFIVRDWPEQRTLAGGIVLDPDAPQRAFRSEIRRQLLLHRADHLDDPVALIESQLQQEGWARKSSLLVKSHFTAADVDEALRRLSEQQKIAQFKDAIALTEWWKNLRHHATGQIEATHRAHPEEAGMRLADLRQALTGVMPPEMFDELVDDLCRTDCAKAGVTIRLSRHRPALPPRLAPAAAKLGAVLSARPLDPPSLKELAPDPLSQQALRFLIQTREAVEIGDELVLNAQSYAQAVGRVRQYLQEHGAATVSELKQALGTSRRIMVPFLEKLDREGITARQGDKRILRKPQ